MASRVAQRALRELLLRHVAQAPVQDRGGIHAVIHRGNRAVLPLMLQQGLFPRLQQERGTQCAGRTGIAPAEAVGTGVSGEVIVHPAAGLIYKAVIRNGQEGEIRRRGGGADLLEDGQGAVKNLLR